MSLPQGYSIGKVLFLTHFERFGLQLDNCCTISSTGVNLSTVQQAKWHTKVFLPQLLRLEGNARSNDLLSSPECDYRYA